MFLLLDWRSSICGAGGPGLEWCAANESYSSPKTIHRRFQSRRPEFTLNTWQTGIGLVTGPRLLKEFAAIARYRRASPVGGSLGSIPLVVIRDGARISHKVSPGPKPVRRAVSEEYWIGRRPHRPCAPLDQPEIVTQAIRAGRASEGKPKVTTSSEIEATKTGDFCFRLFQHQWLFCSVPPARNLRAPQRTRELGTVAPGFAFLGASISIWWRWRRARPATSGASINANSEIHRPALKETVAFSDQDQRDSALGVEPRSGAAGGGHADTKSAGKATRNPLSASAVATFAQDVFRACWLFDEDISDLNAIGAVARKVDMDGQAVVKLGETRPREMSSGQ
jgi:hypothetical protein